jgi:hypothetical protein
MEVTHVSIVYCFDVFTNWSNECKISNAKKGKAENQDVKRKRKYGSSAVLIINTGEDAS